MVFPMIQITRMLTVQTVHLEMTSMRTNAGFTLIEVLVAVIILAMGLIGLAGLQANGLANNQTAYNRSQASQLAYDMADRMRSNTPVANSYVAATAAGVIPACPNGTNNPCTACTTTTNFCTQAQMVAKDVYEWKSALGAIPGQRGLLPNGNGSIVQDPPAGSGIYTITVNWDEKKVQDDGNPNPDRQSFILRTRID